MAENKVTSLEITDKFQVVGTVGKIESMEVKGGGWQFKVVCNDEKAIENLAKAKGKVCVFDIGISANGKNGTNVVSDEEQEGLDFDGEVPEDGE